MQNYRDTIVYPIMILCLSIHTADWHVCFFIIFAFSSAIYFTVTTATFRESKNYVDHHNVSLENLTVLIESLENLTTIIKSYFTCLLYLPHPNRFFFLLFSWKINEATFILKTNRSSKLHFRDVGVST